MGVSLATQNPEAAARLSDTRPLPAVGNTVVYHYRPGQMFGGQTKTAAIVLAADDVNGLLRLFVIKGLDDYLLLDGVPRKRGEDHGWEYSSASPAAGIPAEITELRQRVEVALRDLAELTERFDSLGVEMAGVVVGEEHGNERIEELKKPGMSLFDRLHALKAEIDGAGKGRKRG